MHWTEGLNGRVEGWVEDEYLEETVDTTLVP